MCTVQVEYKYQPLPRSSISQTPLQLYRLRAPDLGVSGVTGVTIGDARAAGEAVIGAATCRVADSREKKGLTTDHAVSSAGPRVLLSE